ncbi:ADP-ribosylglycohydrolase [uncultured virus]|nr:ADP-ribosylglycohydrolase [uncultured virus]
MYQGGWQLPASKWANPYKVGSPGIPDAEAAVIAYWVWLHQPAQATLLSQVGELRAKSLGCWCVDKGVEPCHATVLLYLANGIMVDSLRQILTKYGQLPAAAVVPAVAVAAPAMAAAVAAQVVVAPAAAPKVSSEKVVAPLETPEMAYRAPRSAGKKKAVKAEVIPLQVEVPKPRVELARVRAGFVCLGLGDALGTPHEFPRMSKFEYTGKLEHRFTHRTRWQKEGRTLGVGQASDDSEQALTLARSLIRKQGYDQKDVVAHYIKWAHSGTPMIGTNTRDLFKVNSTKKDPTGYEHYEKAYEKKFGVLPIYAFPVDAEGKAITTEAAEAAQSNGSLMRSFPLACLWNNEAVDRDVWASNPSSVVREAEQLYVTAVRYALVGTPAKEIWTLVSGAAQGAEVKKVFSDILGGVARTLADEGTGEERKKVRGWVLSSFYAAMSCLAALASSTPPTFATLMQWVIGGHPWSDTDTNAAISGALIGSIIGWDELIKDEMTLYNIQVLVAAGKTDTDVLRDPEYRFDDIESVVQGLTALSGLN